MTEARISVFELVVARAGQRYGFLKAGTVAGRQTAYILEWAQYLHETGDDPPTQDRFAVWACISPRTAYYRLDEFRALFPEHDSPSELASFCPVKGVRGLPGTAARDAVPA